MIRILMHLLYICIICVMIASVFLGNEFKTIAYIFGVLGIVVMFAVGSMYKSLGE